MMIGIALLLYCVRSVEVLISMITPDGRDKYLSHNLTLVAQQSKGGGTLWNMDKRGTLYRFRTFRRYAYVNKKERMAMRDGGAEFKKISEDEKIKLMQSIINYDTSSSSSSSNSSSTDSSEDDSSDSQSESSKNDRRGSSRGGKGKSKADRDRENRRKILKKETDSKGQKSEGRSGGNRKSNGNRGSPSSSNNKSKGSGENSSEKQGKKFPKDPIVSKNDYLISPKKDEGRMSSKLVTNEDKVSEAASSSSNSKNMEDSSELNEKNDEESDEDKEKESTAENKKGKTDKGSKKSISGNASNLLGTSEALPASYVDSLFERFSSSPTLFSNGNNSYLNSNGVNNTKEVNLSERDSKSRKRDSEENDDEEEEEDRNEKEENGGFKAGAKKFINNLVGAMKSSSVVGGSKKSGLTEAKEGSNVTRGPGFYFELIPVFKNKVEKGTLIRYQNRCYTHDLRFEKCSFENYWDLDPKYFWSIYHTTDSHYINTLKSYIEKSEERKRKFDSLDCLKVDKCPPRVVCKPVVENNCPPEAKEQFRRKTRGCKPPTNKVNPCQSSSLLSNSHMGTSPLQRQNVLRQYGAQGNQASSQCTPQQGNMCPNTFQSAPFNQGNPQSFNRSQNYRNQNGPVDVSITGGYRADESLGNKLFEAYNK